MGRFQQSRFGLLCTVRLRLYPGDAAIGILPTAIAGACCHVWNHLPADQERRYRLWKAYRIGPVSRTYANLSRTGVIEQ